MPIVEAGGRIDFSGDAEFRPFIGVGEAIYSGNRWDTTPQLIGASNDVAPFGGEFDAPNHAIQ
jgi:hypothetical protein